ncbi:uracil phosphoribosyltransferase [Nanoarchaeota archaeon]
MMGLDTIVTKLFRPILRPETEKRQATNGTAVLRAKQLPKDWKRVEVEYAAPFETDVPYERMVRLGRAWNSPPVVEFCNVDIEGETVGHNLPYGVIGTHNLDLPPMIAAHMQELREGNINPTNLKDVKKFQSIMTNCLTLFFPAVFGKIIADKQGERVLGKIDLTYKLQTDGVELTEDPEVFFDKECPLHNEENVVRTVSGSLSRARAVTGNYYDNIKSRVSGTENVDVDVSFLAVHRAGILPSIIGSYIAEKFGMNTQIVGVDAKRYKKNGGVRARMQAPMGYQHSDHSRLSCGSFVFPSQTGFGRARKQVHIIADPMLATGYSLETTLPTYMNLTGCRPEDVYAVVLFAGGYEGIDRLRRLGVNVIALAHDQADLNSRKFIGPGLGDAGDKLCMLEKLPTYEILQTMQHLAMSRTEQRLASMLNQYSKQITGRRLELMENLARASDCASMAYELNRNGHRI